MIDKIIEYTAVIRTLGTAGLKYRTLLESLVRQTIQPSKILVYIADGYPIPQYKVTGMQYIYVKKGMVAQRALHYSEVETEYILFLDDDLYLPDDFVENMWMFLLKKQADVISPDIYQHNTCSFVRRFTMAVSGRMISRANDRKWGYKVMRNAGFSYNANPTQNVYWSQTNAGACFLCKKEDFLKIHFEDELWMDNSVYALGEDQAMYYKMYLSGLKQLTLFHAGIRHLDAGTSMVNVEKEKMLIYSDFRFKTIFWHRFIYLPETSLFMRLWSFICIFYTFLFSLSVSLLKLRYDILKIKLSAIRDGIIFLKSESYKALPKIVENIHYV